jgi:hypothetical protein
MAIPWFRILDAAIGVTGIARRLSQPSTSDRGEREAIAASPLGAGQLEAKLAGVVVAALKEAFDRDHRRLEIEREQMEAERLKAERALRLELRRQAGDRELNRLRLLTGVAVASWLGTLVVFAGLAENLAVSRVVLGAGWLLLLGAVGAAFAGQAHVARTLGQIVDISKEPPSAVVSSGTAGTLTPWLLLAGLAVIAVGILAA